MPFFTFLAEDKTKVVYWKIEEEESFFLEKATFLDQNEVRQYSNAQNRIQWLAGKLLMHSFFDETTFKTIKKDDLGKPHSVKNDFFLSISHTDKLVGMVVSDKNVGIDIQKFNPKLLKIASKFINEKDLDEIRHSNLNIHEKILVQWSTKEALFKAYGKGQLDFRKNLILNWDHDFKHEGGKFEAIISKNNQNLHYEVLYCYIFEDYLMAIVTKSEALH